MVVWWCYTDMKDDGGRSRGVGGAGRMKDEGGRGWL